MLKYLKTYESYNDIDITENDNFYKIVGTNLINLLKDQLNFLKEKYRKYLNIRHLKELAKKSINMSTTDVLKILNSDYKHRINRLQSNNINIQEIYNEIVSYLYFMHFVAVSLRIDVVKVLETNPSLLGISNKKLLYNIFNLNKISDLDKNIDKYVKTLLHKANYNKKDKDLSKLISFVEKFLTTRYKIWKHFYESETYKQYQLKELPKAKIDDQQKESENKIDKLETQSKPEIQSNSNIDTQINKNDNISKIDNTASITNSFKNKFVQKHGIGAGENNMKQWALDMFAKAEKIYGKPFVINSGYRSPQYQEELRRNPKIKAAKNSPHVQGVAADISLRGTNKRKLIDSLKQVGFNRFGVGKSFLHVDAGDKINPKIWVPYARWSYKY